MVNVGGTFGPIVAGRLRAISWNYAFLAAAISICVMLLITIFFYKEPPREIEGVTLGQKMREIGTALSDFKLVGLLVLLGIGFWLPFWAFFNLCALYVDSSLDTARIYLDIRSVFGEGFASIFSAPDANGVRRVLGETISNTGYIILVLQIFVSSFLEKLPPIPSFAVGLVIAAAGFMIIGHAALSVATWIFLGIFFFAVGEMVSSPRIQEYITWLAPKEKAGLYMGSNFLAVGIGGFTSGIVYTTLYGYFQKQGHPERTWYVLAAHMLVASVIFLLYSRFASELKEQEA